MKIISKNLKDTEEIAKDFIEKLAVASYEGAIVVGLYGDLGSGKTTFTQDVAKILGIKEDITSPTFVIMKSYPLGQSPKSISQKSGNDKENSLLPFSFYLSTLIHIDAYRLDSEKELLSLNWERYLADPRNLILIEWPERVAGILPKNHIKINFKFISENEREIEI